MKTGRLLCGLDGEGLELHRIDHVAGRVVRVADIGRRRLLRDLRRHGVEVDREVRRERREDDVAAILLHRARHAFIGGDGGDELALALLRDHFAEGGEDRGRAVGEEDLLGRDALDGGDLLLQVFAFGVGVPGGEGSLLDHGGDRLFRGTEGAFVGAQDGDGLVDRRSGRGRGRRGHRLCRLRASGGERGGADAGETQAAQQRAARGLRFSGGRCRFGNGVGMSHAVLLAAPSERRAMPMRSAGRIAGRPALTSRPSACIRRRVAIGDSIARTEIAIDGERLLRRRAPVAGLRALGFQAPAPQAPIRAAGSGRGCEDRGTTGRPRRRGRDRRRTVRG